MAHGIYLYIVIVQFNCTFIITKNIILASINIWNSTTILYGYEQLTFSNIFIKMINLLLPWECCIVHVWNIVISLILTCPMAKDNSIFPIFIICLLLFLLPTRLQVGTCVGCKYDTCFSYGPYILDSFAKQLVDYV